MKKYIVLSLMIFSAVLFIFPLAGAEYRGEIFEKLRFSPDDIPQGFIYGTIPPFAKKVLKDNPWKMDKSAIKTLASKIYPGGDSNKIADIYVTILARSEHPYGDDMVCYIIIYHDIKSAADEIRKLSDFVKYNNDRAIVISRENMAVFLHVDDVNDFSLLGRMAVKIEDRINGN